MVVTTVALIIIFGTLILIGWSDSDPDWARDIYGWDTEEKARYSWKD